MEIRQLAAIVLVFGSLSTVTAADLPRDAFTRTWVGRTVRLKQALFTLSYDERGVMGQTRRDKRDHHTGKAVPVPAPCGLLPTQSTEAEDKQRTSGDVCDCD